MKLHMKNVSYQDEIIVEGANVEECTDLIKQQRPTWIGQDNIRIGFEFDEDDDKVVVAECLRVYCKMALRHVGPDAPRAVGGALDMALRFANAIASGELI